MNSPVRGLLIFLLFLAGPSANAQQGSDLEPSEGFFSWVGPPSPYYAALRQSLIGEHPYRKCQMVAIPSFEREWAVYIVRDPSSPAVVVFKRFKKQLWYDMGKAIGERGGDKFIKTEDVRQQAGLALLKMEVDRSTAPIPEKLADILEEVWWRMLGRARYPSEAKSGLDGVTYLLSHWRTGVGFRSGQTWSPDEKTRPREIVKLAEAMAALAQAPSKDKENALGVDARALISRLNSLRQGR